MTEEQDETTQQTSEPEPPQTLNCPALLHGGIIERMKVCKSTFKDNDGDLYEINCSDFNIDMDQSFQNAQALFTHLTKNDQGEKLKIFEKPKEVIK